MRILALVGLAAVVAGIVLGFTVLGGSDARAERPVLRLVRSTPLTVRGERFRPGERVRVTANARTARVVARSRGTFVVTLPGATRCDATRVLAAGSRGSYVVLKLLPSPECLPMRQDGGSSSIG